MLCAYCHPAHSLSTKSQKLASCSVPSTVAWPTGCCMNALVAMMKYPESHEPAKSAAVAARYPTRPSLFSPYSTRPRKVDSRKKAKVPSMASVWPMTPPAYCEKRAQLVPNWNSMGMPVTTPTTKLTPRTLVQNRAAAPACAFPRNACNRKSRTMRARPIVSCGNR